MAQQVGTPSPRPKVGCFGSWAGHIPGLQVQSLVGAYESNQSMFLFLPSSLSKINKYLYIFKK